MQGCRLEDGRHLPAVQGGVCLVSTDFEGLRCGLAHPKAQRLCPCAEADAIAAAAATEEAEPSEPPGQPPPPPPSQGAAKADTP